MKKLFVYCLLLVMCAMVACKKEKRNKVYLMRQEIIDDRAEGKPLDTITYTYDDQNRIIKIVNGTPPNRLTFTLGYDADGRVSVAKKFSSSGNLIIQFDFYYTAEASGYYFYGANHFPSDTAIFTFNDKKQLTQINTHHSGKQLFTYDDKGNVITSTGIGANGSSGLFDSITYGYDNGKNPFSHTPPNNYFFMYVAYTDPSSLINNVQVRNADTYTYTYNEDQFPVKAKINTNSAIISITYSYIVK